MLPKLLVQVVIACKELPHKSVPHEGLSWAPLLVSPDMCLA